MKKVKNPPNHHHVIVTKSCLKRQGEIAANEMSHSWSFSHWCGGGGGGAGGDDEEEETRTRTSSCDLLFLASPEDWALMKPRLTKKTVAFSDKESRKCTLAISEYTQDEIVEDTHLRLYSCPQVIESQGFLCILMYNKHFHNLVYARK